MNLLHQFYGGLAPWLALSLLLLGRNPYPSSIRLIGSLLLAFFLLRIPAGGFSGFCWIALLEPNPSFILTALLGLLVWERIGKRQIFRSCDWLAAGSIGSIAALILYPMGLGLTPIDSYAWGWGSIMPIALASVATILLLGNNRFGLLLIVPLLGTLLHLQESENFWDAVVDPFYAAISLVAMIVFLFGKKKMQQLAVGPLFEQ